MKHKLNKKSSDTFLYSSHFVFDSLEVVSSVIMDQKLNFFVCKNNKKLSINGYCANPLINLSFSIELNQATDLFIYNV